MSQGVELSRVQRAGNSLGILIPRPLLAELVWNCGDRVAIRRHGNQLVIERIPLEEIAQLRSKTPTLPGQTPEDAEARYRIAHDKAKAQRAAGQ